MKLAQKLSTIQNDLHQIKETSKLGKNKSLMDRCIKSLEDIIQDRLKRIVGKIE